MIYIQSVGSLGRVENEVLDVKALWKAISPKMIRRTDRFIQLSLLGANAALEGRALSPHTALYMASGQGNLAVFKRLRDQRYIHKQPPKPVDFINSLSNTAGFYVAQHFGITGKNLNVSRLTHVAETLLLLAQNDLELGREKAVLLGGVDELQEPFDFTRKTLGICDKTVLGEGSNWLLLSAQKEDALASVVYEKEIFTLETLANYLSQEERPYRYTFSQSSASLLQETVTPLLELQTAFDCSCGCGYYETAGLYIFAEFVREGQGTLLYIMTEGSNYRLIRIEIFS